MNVPHRRLHGFFTVLLLAALLLYSAGVVHAQTIQAAGVMDARAVFDEFAAGATMVFQSMHRFWAPLADYCRLLELALGHPVQANAYITPPGAQGFGAHKDEHDVFVLQTHGTKARRVYERHDLPPSRPPLIDAPIASGDSLYIPEGFPHSASTA